MEIFKFNPLILLLDSSTDFFFLFKLTSQTRGYKMRGKKMELQVSKFINNHIALIENMRAMDLHRKYFTMIVNPKKVKLQGGS